MKCFRQQKKPTQRNSQWCSNRVGLLYSLPLDVAELPSIKSSSELKTLPRLLFRVNIEFLKMPFEIAAHEKSL
jgi:hypothetical protein